LFKTCLQISIRHGTKISFKINSSFCIEKINDSWFGIELSPFYQKEVKKYKETIKKEITKLESESKNKKIPLTAKIFCN